MALSNRNYELTDFEQVAVEKRDREIAINMLKKGYEVKSVSEITGLSIAEVNELKKNLK